MLPSLACPKITRRRSRAWRTARSGVRRSQQLRHRHDDVLQQRGRAATAGPRRPWCTGLCGCARAGPGPAGRRSARPGRRPAAAAARCGGRAASSSTPRAESDWYSTSRAECVRPRVRADVVGARVGLPDPQRRGVEQLDGRRPGGDQGGQRAGGRRQVVEDQQARSRRAAAAVRCGTIAEATKASVPSLPMIRWVRMSIGRLWSSSELMP